MNFLIRRGKVSDLLPILDLIEELAVIKNKKVRLSIYDLISDGFSLKPCYKIFVAEKKTEIVGFALFYMTYSINGKSLILEDVFVAKEHKKLGIGMSLFAKCLEFAKATNISRFEWGVLENYTSLMELYRRVGATILKTTSVYAMYSNTINNILEKHRWNIKEMPFENVIIRDGVSNDMSSVLELMHKITVYKKSPCNVSLSDLIKDGFSDNLFKTIVLEINKKVVGMLLFYNSYSVFEGKSLIIEDVLIEKKYRGYGLGKLLYYKLFQYANAHGKNRIEQAIYDFDKEAIKRCLKMGAKKITGMRLIQIDYKTLDTFVNKNT